MEHTKIVAPESWKTNLQWFERTDEDARLAYAKEYASKVFAYGGQACVVISYPRHNDRVAIYDMDSGRVMWTSLDLVKKMIASETYRDSESNDFEWSAINDSLVSDEAHDMGFLLFPNV